MKIVFVVDTPNWAFDNIAKRLKDSLTEHNVNIIYTSKYNNNYSVFLKDLELLSSDADVIHFFWRDYLNEILRHVKNVGSKFQDLLISKVITTHIPDHLYLSNLPEIEARLEMLNFVDGYFTTSKKLYSQYCELHYVPEPITIIQDCPSVKAIDNITSKDTFDVVWIGNSKWGEHLSLKDYKGLNTIVLPAVKSISEKHKSVRFFEFDKSKKHTEHDVILECLSNADVLLISSVEEGTPLPLIEAMANRCAIISTDVGICREILPEIQQEYIVERSSQSFENALEKLVTNPNVLAKIKNENYDSFIQWFGTESSLPEKWIKFFKEAQSRSNVQIKKDFFSKYKASPIQEKLGQLVNKSVGIANQLGLTDYAKNSKLLREQYYKITSKMHTPSVDYRLFEKVYQKNIKGKEYIALYSGYWHGVANSTKSFFGDNSLAFPLFSTEYPQVSEHSFLDGMAGLLASSSSLKSVILSGGTLLQIKLAEKIRGLNPNIKIYFCWHGSPAQWTEISQYHTFNDWRKLYQQKVIDGVLSFKPELDKTLNSFGIDSISIKNYMIDTNHQNVLSHPTADEYKVGFFAALFSWYKNPFPQLLALGDVSGCKLTTNLDIVDSFDWVAEHISIEKIPPHLPNASFVSMLANLHVVLYVTNTECSPMIALESIAVGTPCIVGPAGNIYKGNKRLEELLVVTEVDNPTAISNKVNEVRENYDEIKELISKFKSEYNNNVDLLKDKMLETINND